MKWSIISYLAYPVPLFGAKINDRSSREVRKWIFNNHVTSTQYLEEMWTMITWLATSISFWRSTLIRLTPRCACREPILSTKFSRNCPSFRVHFIHESYGQNCAFVTVLIKRILSKNFSTGVLYFTNMFTEGSFSMQSCKMNSFFCTDDFPTKHRKTKLLQ